MKFAIFGDVHGRWQPNDAARVDAMGVDAVIFVGDLADRWQRRTLRVARRLARLRTPAFLLPGNHDATHPLDVLFQSTRVSRGWEVGAGRAHAQIGALQRALGRVRIMGFNRFDVPAHDLSIVFGRPFSMGGGLTFPRRLAALHSVRTPEESQQRLQGLLPGAQGRLVFVGHNGPFGCGADDKAPWSAGGRDRGDHDLGLAVDAAKRAKKKILAVVAGHIHHDARSRDWLRRIDDVQYVNAARWDTWGCVVLDTDDGVPRLHWHAVSDP